MTTDSTQHASPRRGRRYAAVLAAFGAIGLAIAIALLSGAWPSGSSAAAEEPLQLSLGEGAALSSCIRIDAAILGEMPMAFEGTVTAYEHEQVTLTVDRWFKGGDALTVVLAAPPGMRGLTGGIDFTVGRQYLISASDGTVNYCGFSGPSDPELSALFEAAFPS
jgi:hypothetical protein